MLPYGTLLLTKRRIYLLISINFCNFAAKLLTKGRMNKQIHPIWDLKYIQEHGVLVTEVENLPPSKSPIQSEALVIGLCLSGSIKFMYNMEEKEFVPKELGVTLPNVVISNGEASPDYRAILVIISKEYFDKLVHHSSFVDYKKYYFRPNCNLTDEHFNNIRAILRVLRIVSESDHPRHDELLEENLDLLFYAITRYRGEEGKKSEAQTRNEKLISRFYDLLIANYHIHHDLSWYARQLCLSRKYFSAVMRQNTGKSAAEWIDIILVMHAKKLLRTRRDLTIQQIAFELGFSESATFCRYFKEQTGLRPKEYREI